MLFASEAVAAIVPTLAAARESLAGCANSGTAGYWGGAQTPLRTIEKTAFADDATATVAGETLHGGGGSLYVLAACANSGTAGYWAGGYSGATDAISKTAFSDDATATIVPTLSASRYGLNGAANSGTAGYWGGGYEAAYVTVLDKTTFSDDATAAIVPTLSNNSYSAGGLADVGNAAFWDCFQNGSWVDVLDKTTFSDDATASITATLSDPRGYCAAYSDTSGL
jgi:hypothetical protein